MWQASALGRHSGCLLDRHMVNGQPFRVLLIDGNRAQADIIEGWLSESSEPQFEVERTTDLVGARKLAETHSFDVILSGAPAGGELGFEIVDRLEELFDAPIVMLGASRDDWIGVQLVRHSAQDFLDVGAIAARARELVVCEPIGTGHGPILVTVSIAVCEVALKESSVEQILRELQLGLESKQDYLSTSGNLLVLAAEEYAPAAK